jgi:HAE1 family hydrophobic/amphiphilic exporter-1
MIQKLQATGMIEDINTDFQEGMPEIHVKPNRDQAAQMGVSVSSMGSEVSNLVGGQILNADTQYPKDAHRYYIRMRSEPHQHDSPKSLDEVLLRNNRGSSGDLVPLSKTSDIEVSSAIQLVSRLNRQRAIPVYANVAHNHSQQSALAAVERIGKEVLPPGYRILITGSAQAFRDAFESLIFALILGIVVAYMVLASQFNSFIHPITVLMALPFSLSGAFSALYLTHQSLNLFSMIGLVLLMGIVKKNSILLVDFTNQRRAEGLTPSDALLEACPVRLRPILMTSVATVVGAIPGALALGPGAETRIPMAISIIGGVTISTLLTLFAVPCVYSLFTRLERPDVDLEVSGVS